MKGKQSALIITVLAAALWLIGCSTGKQADTKTAAQTDAKSEAAAEVKTEAEANTNAEPIVLRCGVKQAHLPFSYTDDKGNLIGLEEDVVTEAFNRIDGYEVEIVGFDASPALFAALQAGSIDFGSGQYVASAARKETYKFPAQYYALSPMYLAGRKEDNLQTLSDIAGETLEFASTSYEKEIIDTYNAANPGKEINIVDTSGDTTAADNLQQIATNQRNVLLIYKSSYDTVQKDLNLENLTLSDEPVIVEDVYQVFNQSVPDEFIDKFDEALKSMFADGTLGKIAEKWTGENTIDQYKDLVIPVE
nr:transporter substrate-binding domain-containing protein [uncultured Clostridium sp.]